MCHVKKLKGIGGCYGLCIIWMPSFLRARRKGAVFIGGGKRVQFFMVCRSASQSGQQAEKHIVMMRVKNAPYNTIL